MAEPAAKPPRAAVQLVLQASPSSPGHDAPRPRANSSTPAAADRPLHEPQTLLRPARRSIRRRKAKRRRRADQSARRLVAGSGVGPAGLGGPLAERLSLSAPQHLPAGLPGRFSGPPRLEGPAIAGPMGQASDIAVGPRRVPGGTGDGWPSGAAVGEGRLEKADSPGLLGVLGDAVRAQPAAGAAATPRGAGGDLAVDSGVGEPQRQGGGLPGPSAVRARHGWRRRRGAGGGDDFPPQLGVPGRFGRGQGAIVATTAPRFLAAEGGGGLARHSSGPAIDGTVSEPTEAYRHRAAGSRRKGLRAGGGEGTELAVERGLDFFARLQFPDGHWSLHELPPGLKLDDPALGQMQSDTAATGLVLLTYLGGGYTHLDDKHRTVVRKGLEWLIRHQKPDGDLFSGGTKYAWFYSHGIAAIALCEAYGMTQDPELRRAGPQGGRLYREVAESHPRRLALRCPRSTGQASETDTSVTGWQLMALKSAQMAGLEVPAETFRKIDALAGRCRGPGRCRALRLQSLGPAHARTAARPPTKPGHDRRGAC